MEILSRNNQGLGEGPPIKVVQFGEGNFLRAFIGPTLQALNEKTDFNGGIAVVQPIAHGMVDKINQQEGLYTLITKGIKNAVPVEKKTLITNLVRGINPYDDYAGFLSLAQERHLKVVVSNTTEAGIAYDPKDTLALRPPNAFPAKLTAFLWERFQFFKGDAEKGVAILPCELINNNGDTLRSYVMDYVEAWDLPTAFGQWLTQHCTFHNTLVDRIVPGYPAAEREAYQKELGYVDALMVSAEHFFLWVIEGDDKLRKLLPFELTDYDVKIVDDLQPFRTRKVRILNGAHTAMVPFSLLYGNDTVRESVEDDFTGPFMQRLVFNEVIPGLPMPTDTLTAYAHDVLERFQNPFIVHQLSSIALNSISKFKVRVLPSLLAYLEEKGQLPVHIVYCFACLLRFYKGQWDKKDLPVQDDTTIMEDFKELWRVETLPNVVHKVLSNATYWGQDLTEVEGLSNALVLGLEAMEAHGIKDGFSKYQQHVNN